MNMRRLRQSEIASICFMLFSCARLQAQTKPELSVAMIMRDPKWLGSFPQNPYWSENSDTLYFEWNPEAHAADSLHQVLRSAGPPTKVSRARQKVLPPPGGKYNRGLSQKVFERAGDIFLFDLKTGTCRQITNTVETESNPRFSFA